MDLPDYCEWSRKYRDANRVSLVHQRTKMIQGGPRPLPNGLNYLCSKCHFMTNAATWGSACSYLGAEYELSSKELVIDADFSTSDDTYTATDSSMDWTPSAHPSETSKESCSSDISESDLATGAARISHRIQRMWFHHSLLDLRKSVQAGCHLCFTIWHSLEFEFYGGDPGTFEETIGDTTDAKELFGLPFIESSISSQASSKCGELNLKYTSRDGSVIKDLRATVELYPLLCATEDAPLKCPNVLTGQLGSSVVHHVDSNQSVRFKKTFKRLRSWLLNCSQRYPQNRINGLSSTDTGPRSRPSRLLHVSSANDVRLEDSALIPEGIAYATLSYCWGKTTNLELTRSNLAQFSKRIPIERAPKTVREAVEATVLLGLHYLWIDALCIIQHDQEDWQHEAMSVPQIYAGGYVNLCAASAAGCDEGLFIARGEELEMNPAVLSVNVAGMLQGPCLAISGYATSLYCSPLDARGWTLQEGILAPRSIFFYRDYIRWACCHTSDREFGANDLMIGPHDALNPERLRLPWLKLIDDEYVDRLLTRESDRLIALSGVAQVYATRLKLTANDYLAGLWRPDLWYQLLWLPGIGSLRHSDHMGPSWSWISLDAPFLNVTTSAALTGPTRFTQHDKFRLLQACMQHSGEGAYGGVKYGSLRIQGMLQKVNLAHPQLRGFRRQKMESCSNRFGSLQIGEVQVDSQYLHQDYFSLREELCSEYLDDSRLYENLECRCVLLPLARLQEDLAHDRHAYGGEGLLLQRVAGMVGTYRRIGVLRANFFSDSIFWEAFWKTGCQLTSADYLSDCSGGVYEFQII